MRWVRSRVVLEGIVLVDEGGRDFLLRVGLSGYKADQRFVLQAGVVIMFILVLLSFAFTNDLDLALGVIFRLASGFRIVRLFQMNNTIRLLPGPRS